MYGFIPSRCYYFDIYTCRSFTLHFKPFYMFCSLCNKSCDPDCDPEIYNFRLFVYFVFCLKGRRGSSSCNEREGAELSPLN